MQYLLLNLFDLYSATTPISHAHPINFCTFVPQSPTGLSLHSLECLLHLKAVLCIINLRKSQASYSSSFQLHLSYYLSTHLVNHDVSYPILHEVPQHWFKLSEEFKGIVQATISFHSGTPRELAECMTPTHWISLQWSVPIWLQTKHYHVEVYYLTVSIKAAHLSLKEKEDKV